MQHLRVTNRFLLAFHRCLHLPRHRLPLFQCPLHLRRPLRLNFNFFFRSELAFNISVFLKPKLSREELNLYCKRWKSFIYLFIFFCPCFVFHTFVQTFLEGQRSKGRGCSDRQPHLWCDNFILVSTY